MFCVGFLCIGVVGEYVSVDLRGLVFWKRKYVGKYSFLQINELPNNVSW